MSESAEYSVYTDGASSGNPGPSGWGAVILGVGRRREIGGAELLATNNQMEMRAVIESLAEIPPDATVAVHSDSGYVIDGITKYIRKWRTNGYRKSDKSPVENRELWEEMDALCGTRARFVKVPAHAGVRENERANDLAQAFSRGERVKLKDDPWNPAAASSAPAGEPVRLPARMFFPCYVVVLAGALKAYGDWETCRRAVENVRGVRYKRCKSREELDFTLEKWGLRAMN